ncbi:endoplasmic reticulum lectin 1-like [Liolophura sinensis]|uniref:endoplasmic reticulum lectin 1-like n=1 Tax=Liolophura sinensis TaxID=3198878 RepID=UPI003158471E
MYNMNFDVRVIYVAFLAVELRTVACDFDPFMDSDWFSINWAGPATATKDDVLNQLPKENTVVVTTTDNEKYRCSIPDLKDQSDKNTGKSFTGTSVEELMENLYAMKSCSYRIEPYWTYELCHGKHIRQYNEQKEPGKKSSVQEFFLGYYKPVKPDPESEDSLAKTAKKKNVDTRKVEDLELPYYKVTMEDGTMCDVTGQPRKSSILYVCQPHGRGEIYQFKEVSSCEYEVMVLTSTLCKHPDYRPKEPDVNKIHCHALDGSPEKPKRYQQSLMETKYGKYTIQPESKKFSADDELEEGDTTPPAFSKPSQPTRPRKVHKVSDVYHGTKSIGPSTDKQLLQEFLAGDYCLHGGAGWWKHEFCYGRFVSQYHQEPAGRTTIYLGHWNKEKHLAWLMEKPHKRPKAVGKRRWISQYYSNGDVCDITNKRRTVEVRLKCKHNPEQPHAVSLYLVEPLSCEYELVVSAGFSV